MVDRLEQYPLQNFELCATRYTQSLMSIGYQNATEASARDYTKP